MRLRDRLIQDFCIDLPIDDGAGTRDDPIVICSDDPQEIARAAEVCLAFVQLGFGRANGQEIFWSVGARERCFVRGANLLRYRLDRLVISEGQAAREWVEYYFSALSSPPDAPIGPHVVFTDQLVGVSFPYNLAGLNYQDFHSYEEKEPGRGYSVAYSGPSVTANLYVFSGERTEADPADYIGDELVATLAWLRDGTPGIELASWFGPWGDFSSLTSGFECDLEGGRRTMVLLDRYRNRFLKWRVTWRDDERRSIADVFVDRSRRLFVPPDA